MNATDDRTTGPGVDLHREGSAQWMLDRTSGGTGLATSNRQPTQGLTDQTDRPLAGNLAVDRLEVLIADLPVAVDAIRGQSADGYWCLIVSEALVTAESQEAAVADLLGQVATWADPDTLRAMARGALARASRL